jgi:hypothetical protein
MSQVIDGWRTAQLRSCEPAGGAAFGFTLANAFMQVTRHGLATRKCAGTHRPLGVDRYR